MGIRVVWDNAEKTTARMDFESAWTWTEFHDAQMMLNSMRASVKNPVSIILNLAQAQPMPLEGAVSNLQFGAHHVEYYTVFVAIKPVAKELIEILLQSQPEVRAKVFFADTLDEARKLLANL